VSLLDYLIYAPRKGDQVRILGGDEDNAPKDLERRKEKKLSFESGGSRAARYG